MKKTFLLIICMFLLYVYVHAQATMGTGADTLKTDVAKIAETVLNIISIIAGSAAGVMVAIHGITYMTKPASERGEDDARKLKANIIKIAIGAGLVIGASTLGKVFITV